MRRRVTLGQLFTGAAIAIAIVVVSAFTLFVRASHASILRSSQEQQRLVAGRVEARVVRELGRAQRVLENVERAIRTGALDIDDRVDLEQALFTRMVDEPHLEEVTFTRASLLGYDPEGEALLAEGGRWDLSVYRSASGALVTKSTRRGNDGAYAVSTRDRGKDTTFGAVAFRGDGTAPDPTTHATFSVAAAERHRGTPIWSDLHWSELDHAVPQRERRIVVSVQKAVEDAAGRFLGVARVGIVTSELDAIARVQSTPGATEDVQRIALLATAPKQGDPRLVARLDPSDRVVTDDDEIRFVSDRPPPEIRALLGSAVVRDLDPSHPNAEGSLVVDGEPWLATIREIDLGDGGTSGWMVAILAPESRYTADLAAFEQRIIATFAITIGVLLAIGAATVIALRRGLARVTGATMRMRAFDFAPGGDHSAIRDIDEVMYGLERAKTVVRAMGKFVPIDLVRRLYESNEEPELGGEMLDVALMFTDIEGFTTLAEKLPPDVLAKRLGDYLAAMTGAIEATGGTIDKYIGDAVMAIWNAPTRVDHYGVQACRAALACMKATKELYASSAWAGLPPLITRFGIHEARVMIGNFGAPTRLTYTALGDGVNLAARLEPLCKQYGVTTLVSDAIVQHAKHELVFRLIDRVAVKGKTEGIDVYELLGAKGDVIEELPRARRYEEAFGAYLERDFERAITLVESDAAADAPSAVLVERCRRLARNPPPPAWKGVHVASTK